MEANLKKFKLKKKQRIQIKNKLILWRQIWRNSNWKKTKDPNKKQINSMEANFKKLKLKKIRTQIAKTN